jgi:glycosyltransferase involved in cell wall biosynthesis
MSRRLLMVANPFPPMASGGNARQVRFARYLPENGWEVTILAARATGPAVVPPGLRVERAATPGPEGLYAAGRRASRSLAARRGGSTRRTPTGGQADERVAARDEATAATASEPSATAAEPARGPQHRFSRRALVNDWFFVPDQYVGWILPAIALGRSLLQSQKYDAILSSYPAPSTEIVASSLAQWSHLPWLADYRDPWATRHLRHYPTGLHRRTHFSLESRALSRACFVTATNRPIADDLTRRFPPLTGRVEVLPNGFDPLEQPEEVPPLGDGLWLVHTGRLYGRSQQLERVLTAFAALPADVKLLFVGVEGGQIAETAARLGVGDRVRTLPYVPHAVALGYQRAARGLLLITSNSPEALSSKVFEYLAAGKPIFAYTPVGSAAHDLLQEAGGAVCAPQSDLPDELLRAFAGAVRDGSIGPPDRAVVQRYDGRALTARLAGLLDGMLPGMNADRTPVE